MNSTRLRALTTTTGPFASVYIDDSHNTEDAAHAMELRWRALRDELISAGAEPAVVDPIGTALLGQVPSVGVSGRAVIAGPDGVILDEQLIRPPVTPDGPLLAGALSGPADRARHRVALPRGRRRRPHRGPTSRSSLPVGVSVKTETVEGEGYPVHHAASAESPPDTATRSSAATKKDARTSGRWPSA